jgi:hypothetical protein
MTTSNTVCPNCDECGSELLDVSDGQENEIYCPICDVGDDADADGSGDINQCECGCLLSTWYPFSSCPSCLSPKENTTKH